MEVKLFLFAIGYLAIVLIGVVVALVWSIRRKLGFFKTAGVVLATLLVMYAIPFGDHTLGEIKKDQLCRELGGTKIYQVVENVEGFMWRTGQQMQPYRTYGYQFLEVQTVENKVFRYTAIREGVIEEQKIDSSQARYSARLMPEEKLGAYHLVKKFVVLDNRNNNVIASLGTVAYRGGWLGLGSVVCPEERLDAVTFVQQVLKPGKSKE